MVASGPQWHTVHFYEWTHSENRDATLPERTIICWHGLARNGRDYDYLAQHLVKAIPNARVIAVDTPGRGLSENLVVPTHYNLQTYAVVAMCILNAIGQPSSIDWVGTSMGGLLGMLLSAASIKCPIRKLALVDIGPFVTAAALARLATYVGKDPKFDTMEEGTAYIKSIYSQMGDLSGEDWTYMASYILKKTADGKIGFHYDPAIGIPFGLDAPKDIDMWIIWEMIKTTKIMLLHGEKSDILLQSTVDQMTTRGPKLDKLVQFPDCGHTPHLYSQAKIGDLVSWLQQ